jgi:chromosome segregation ATPase
LTATIPHNNSPNTGNQWADLVANKRQFAKELREITDKIVEADNTISDYEQNIKTKKNETKDCLHKIILFKEDLRNFNSELLAVSDKISQSKGFLSVVEKRLPKGDEAELIENMSKLKEKIDSPDFQSKNDMLEQYRKASMNLEAVKAVRTVREQITKLVDDSKNLSNKIMKIEAEVISLEARISQNQVAIEKISSSKNSIQEKRETLMAEYNNVLSSLDGVNKKLDLMATDRKKFSATKQGGYYSSRDEYESSMIEFKQSAERKMKAGEKLTLDELRIIFQEN